ARTAPRGGPARRPDRTWHPGTRRAARPRQRLADFAAAEWPTPGRGALARARAAGTVFGPPIVHYKPSRLVTGRVALAGDAAHAASPMVGGGFRQGLYDVRALTQAMTGLTTTGGTPGALRRYQE